MLPPASAADVVVGGLVLRDLRIAPMGCELHCHKAMKCIAWSHRPEPPLFGLYTTPQRSSTCHRGGSYLQRRFHRNSKKTHETRMRLHATFTCIYVLLLSAFFSIDWAVYRSAGPRVQQVGFSHSFKTPRRQVLSTKLCTGLCWEGRTKVYSYHRITRPVACLCV